jgi:cytochrome c-type biogenesis protein CcmE
VIGSLRRWQLPVLGGAIGVVVALLMVTAIRAATSYYYTLPQFRALGAAAVGRFVQVNGRVAPGFAWRTATETLRFTLLPPAGASGRAAPLPVVFRGPEPDGFTAGTSAVVAGRLQPDGTFVAQQVLIKCPSHYEAAPSGSGAAWPGGA